MREQKLQMDNIHTFDTRQSTVISDRSLISTEHISRWRHQPVRVFGPFAAD